MPKVLTDAYRDAAFIVPFTEDKSEYCLVRPMTDTALNVLRIEAAKEGGADDALAGRIFLRRMLQKAVVDCAGFYDVAGNELAHSPEMLAQICECDPEFAGILSLRIRNVARLGELEERKTDCVGWLACVRRPVRV